MRNVFGVAVLLLIIMSDDVMLVDSLESAASDTDTPLMALEASDTETPLKLNLETAQTVHLQKGA